MFSRRVRGLVRGVVKGDAPVANVAVSGTSNESSRNRFALVRLAALAATLGAWLALASVAAQAHYVNFSSFGSVQLAGSNPIGVAVDQSSRDIYVTTTANTIYKFDSSGNVISPPSPFNDPNGSGVYSGVAVDPVRGDVYAIDAGLQQVDTFDPATGALLSSFADPGSANVFGVLAVMEIATDAAGNVYVPNGPNNEVQKFGSAGNLLQTFTGSGADALSAPTGVAVDASGNVWVADAGNNRIEKFDSGGSFVSQIASGGVLAVAVDASGNVFGEVRNSADSCAPLSSPCYHVVEYSAAGAQLDDFGAGMIATSTVDPSVINTLAVDSTSGDVYVADGGNNVVWVFGPQTAPKIDAEYATSVTGDSAIVNAQIDPAAADTTYHFEYGTSTSYGNSTPAVDIGSGKIDVPVSQHLQSLTAGTSFHYRVVATNSFGTTDGPDHTFTTPSSSAAGPDSCPNAAIRAQQRSAYLADCRAYEQVTPTDKGSGALPLASLTFSFSGGVHASINGDKLGYATLTSWPGAQFGGTGYYLASRAAGGWSSQSLSPHQGDLFSSTSFPQIVGYSVDLSKALLTNGNPNYYGQDDPLLVAGEPANHTNLFLRDNTDGSFRLMNATPAGATPGDTLLSGISADASHVIFTDPAKLTPDAIDFTGRNTEDANLYQWAGGVVSLIGQAPIAPATECGAGGPACAAGAQGAEAGAGYINVQLSYLNGVSLDGSKVFFDTNPGRSASPLYVRENATKTVEYSASKKTNGSGPGGTDPTGPWNPRYVPAAADGSAGFLLSCEQLTNDSTAVAPGPSGRYSGECDSGGGPFPGAGQDLYRYDTGSGVLADLTVDHTPGDTLGADVLGTVGSSVDGSSIYFVARGVLANGATAGQPNLYLYRGGTTTYIATLDPRDGLPLWLPYNQKGVSRVTSDGRYLVFPSLRSLTGYDNTIASGPSCGNPEGIPEASQCQEIFEYDAASNQLRCVSCNPTGGRPIGPSNLTPAEGTLLGRAHATTLLRNVMGDGRVFFESQDALVPGDVNGAVQDVYEYDNGAVHLISGGTSGYPSTFFDASPSGNDVFFDTNAPLAPQDGDSVLDVYDAHVGGGFPFTPAPTGSCQGDSCLGAPGAAPAVPAAASVTFSGPGNAASGGAAAIARVKVLTRVVHGPTFFVRVSVPGPGRITIAGATIKTVNRSVPRAGVYRLKVSLTVSGRRALKHKRKLKLNLRVRYAPVSGQPSSTTVSLTDKR